MCDCKTRPLLLELETEIEELNLPRERCIEVSAKDAGALEELRDGLARLRCEEVV